MKKFIYFSLTPLITIITISNVQSKETNLNLPMLFSLSATTTWMDFPLAPTIHQYNNKQCAWTGLITLKSTQPINLQKLQLQWTGAKISRLQASLYQKKDAEQTLIPIQENLVCDGVWNPKTQYVTFFLDKKIVAVNKYYLVLNFPIKDAQKIKHGTFTIPKKKILKISCLE